MFVTRVLIIRASLVMNALLIVYLCLTWMAPYPIQQVHAVEKDITGFDPTSGFRKFIEVASPDPPNADSAPRANSIEAYDGQPFETNEEPPREVQESQGVIEMLSTARLDNEEVPDPPLNSLERKIYPNLRDCVTKPLKSFYSQRGDYWILENYIPAVMSFRCDESITYSTHAEYTFLDNLDPLASRWQGPVSVAVYTPGDDLEQAIRTILHLRECWGEGIKKYVTFHLYFHTSHVPKKVPNTDEILQRKVDCSQEAPKWSNITTYRQEKKLVYPINVARNTARLLAQTYFVCASDVELYPSINFIPDFMDMLKKPDKSNTTLPRVFVFPIFEVQENLNPPETKGDLISMMGKGEVVPFHKKVCARCHNIPQAEEWRKASISPGLSVFHIAKRKYPFHTWEPIYVGTNNEPIYDERLSWEGKRDKMTQVYILCVRDYEFHILDNAFLVHRPGIKTLHKDPSRDKLAAKQSSLIGSKIKSEYRVLFGTAKGCNL